MSGDGATNATMASRIRTTERARLPSAAPILALQSTFPPLRETKEMVTPRSMKPWILVTGASGFIGGALVKRLLERGERVKAFVRAGANLKGLEGLPGDRFEIAVGDVTVEHTVYRALASCSQLFHVAGAFEYGPRH